MNFELTDDQVQIQGTVRRLLADRYSTTLRNRYLAEETGWSADLWRAYADMGLTALAVPSEFGGLGGNAEDLYVVMRELGHASILEPYLGSCVAAATAISLGGSVQQRELHLPKIASGESIFAWASEGASGPGSSEDEAETVAASAGNGWQLNGTKSVVLHAAASADLVVSALLPIGSRALFLVRRDAPGLGLRRYRLVDGSSAADIRFDGVAAELLGLPDEHAGEDVILRAESACIAAICAEAVGAMRAALELTVTHLNTRAQFGKPLANNQALRHRCADMAVMLECSESMAMLAAITLSDAQGCEPGDLSMARTVVMRNGRSLCEHAVQLHGGIGMTEEYGVGRYLQRMMVLEQLFGATVRRLAKRPGIETETDTDELAH
ncbi:MAG: acyl-CoA dehydrogenase family protein [Devosia sp.]